MTDPAAIIVDTTNCTIYYRTDIGYGVSKVYAKTCKLTAGKYAQYDHALELRFRKPRQRRDRGLTFTYDPTLIIVAGKGPDPDGAFLPAEPGTTEGVTVSKGRYMSCDSRWSTDLHAIIDASGCEVLFDSRQWNTHSGAIKADEQAA